MLKVIFHTLFTFPSNRAYSSRTSCSRLVTRGFAGRRRGFSLASVVDVVVAGGGGVGMEDAIVFVLLPF